MTSEINNTTTMYTDGSCSPNPGVGGYAALLRHQLTDTCIEKEITGCHPSTTNNRMELMAVIEGLKALKRPTSLTIFTDSTYVQQGITKWIHQWEVRNFKKVKNVDLWMDFKVVLQSHKVQWVWVKAHNGHIYNERVDQLAKIAAQKCCP